MVELIQIRTDQTDLKHKFAILKHKNKKYADEIKHHLALTNKRMEAIEEMKKEVRNQFANRDYKATELFEQVRTMKLDFIKLKA